ncbi:discoidin domain-containing protein [Formosa sp. S-31]|uniref:discoidin domain-containing protein n=1 Tax=Formosa sp. S-31 TaxID=2790949 RepID=UPI003EBB753A
MNILNTYKSIFGAAIALALAAFTFVSCDEDLVYPEQSKLPPATYNTSEWDIAAYSTQEDQDGEGPSPYGRAIAILDGNTDTFWHSCWNGCTPTVPHFISVDMKTEKEVAGFYLVQRQSLTRNIESLELLTSNDGSSWTSQGVYTLEKIKSQQVLELNETQTFRYYKMEIKSVFDGTNHAALAELVPYISYN